MSSRRSTEPMIATPMGRIHWRQELQEQTNLGWVVLHSRVGELAHVATAIMHRTEKKTHQGKKIVVFDKWWVIWIIATYAFCDALWHSRRPQLPIWETLECPTAVWPIYTIVSLWVWRTRHPRSWAALQGVLLPVSGTLECRTLSQKICRILKTKLVRSIWNAESRSRRHE